MAKGAVELAVPWFIGIARRSSGADLRAPKPVSSWRPISIYSSESRRGAATIISSSMCSLGSDDSASGSGGTATFQIAVRMGIAKRLSGA